MSKDNKIRPEPDEATGMSLYNNRHSGQNLSVPDYTSTTPTAPASSKRDTGLKNVFGVDKLDITFQRQEFGYCQTRPPEWTEKTIQNDRSKETKYYYQNKDIGYIAEIITDQPSKAGFLKISANPSKPYHEYELTSNTIKIFDFYRTVLDDLRKHEVETDLEQAKISRLDVAHNLVLNHELLTYNNVFDTLQGKRHFKRSYGDSRYWKNGENEFIIYNKRKEIIEQHRKKINMPNITRAEVKALKGRSVKKVFGVHKLGDILEKTFVEEYNLFVTERILRTNFGTQLRFDFEQLEKSFMNCIDKFGRNRAIDNFLRIIGVEALSETKNGLIYFQEIIKSNYHERTVRRQMSKINDLLSVLKPVQQKKEEIFTQLNEELRTKLLVA